MKAMTRSSLLALLLPLVSYAATMPPPIEESQKEPVRYVGDRVPDKAYFDGRLPHAVGTHHYQVLRANRTHPEEAVTIPGWTYSHQAYLAYWNGRFFLQYLSDELAEHTPPSRCMLTSSVNGKDWEPPVVVFPTYSLPEIRHGDYLLPAGTPAVMHQRMAFYVAPNGKLLVSGFYSYCPTPRHSPNAGQGLGRVVREIKKDGSFGPIYFIRYNRHNGYNETNTNFPFYQESEDTDFLEACEALLADKLISLQWWEEDRAEDGFYVIDPGDVENAAYFSADIVTSAGAGKALSYFTRPDGIVVGLWKNQWGALSPDRGETWTKITNNTTLLTTGAKTWGQQTDDGRFAIVHNQSPTFSNRFPMTVMSSDDGHTFDDLLILQAEVPPKRYQGLHKTPGSQYFRGIVEGNGNPPGDHLWVVYSMNKEDIWISRTAVPLRGVESSPVNQDFESADCTLDLEFWNIHSPRWAPSTITLDPETGNRVLEIKDEEPYDYARVERVFPASKKVKVSFLVKACAIGRGHALDVEVQSQTADRPMRLRIDESVIGFDHRRVKFDPLPFSVGNWHKIELVLDCEAGEYRVSSNGGSEQVIAFQESPEYLERLVFRTGPYRGWIPPQYVEEGMWRPSGVYTEDAPGADVKAPKTVFWIDDVSIQPLKP